MTQKPLKRKMDIADLARAYFGAYLRKQRETLEEILREDFTFRCPLGDPIDRAAYFEQCWPGNTKIQDIRFESLLTAGEEAMVRYEATLISGATFRSAEYLRAQDGELAEVVVYFGTHPDRLFAIFDAAA